MIMRMSDDRSAAARLGAANPVKPQTLARLDESRPQLSDVLARADIGEPEERSQRRAGRVSSARQRRNFALVTAALLAALAFIAAPGWGLGFSVADLFSGEPAPPDVQQTVHGADVGAPPGMAPGIEASETSKVTAITLADGRTETLWVAPTTSGGLCVYAQRGSLSGGPGCGPSKPPTDAVDWSIQGRAEYDNTFVIYGRVPDRATRVDLSFADGKSVPLTLTKGFFLYEIPPAHIELEARPFALTAYDDDRNEVANTTLMQAAVDAAFLDAQP
jgi:hypothetical protein